MYLSTKDTLPVKRGTPLCKGVPVYLLFGDITVLHSVHDSMFYCPLLSSLNS